MQQEVMSITILRESGSWGESFRWKRRDGDGSLLLSRTYPTAGEAYAAAIEHAEQKAAAE